MLEFVPGDDDQTSKWWGGLSPGLTERVDALVLQDERHAALRAIWEHCAQGSPLRIGDVQSLVADRHRVLADHIRWKPVHPSREELTARLDAIEAPIAAIEAVWDGDSFGWVVLLLAIVAQPSKDHPDFAERALGSYRGETAKPDRRIGVDHRFVVTQ